jgi:hypothetical protein
VDSSGAVQWTLDGVAICTAADYQCDPTIVSDGSGGAIITWEDSRSGTNSDIYAQRVDSSGAVQWTLDGVAVCTAANSQWSPTIVSDGSGGAIITWYDYRSGTSDIYAQRVDYTGSTGVEEEQGSVVVVPIRTFQIILENSPNPFEAKTKISYALPKESRVTLTIYNVAGQKVKTLVNRMQSAGMYSADWNGKDDQGRNVASGVYFYRLDSENFKAIRKMIVVR